MSDIILDDLFEKYAHVYPDKLRGTWEFSNFQERLKNIGYHLSEEEIITKISVILGVVVDKSPVEDKRTIEYKNFLIYLQKKEISTFKELIETYLMRYPKDYNEHLYLLDKFLKTKDKDGWAADSNNVTVSYYLQNINGKPFAVWIRNKFSECEKRRAKKKSQIKSRYFSIDDIDILSGYEFERFLVRLFQDIGYKVTHTKLSNDQGADLVLFNNEKLTIVQAKRYSKTVGNKAVQEAVAAIGFYSGQKGMVVCNRSFTKSAIALAHANKIRLVDREELSDWLCLRKIEH